MRAERPCSLVSTDVGIDDALALIFLNHFARPPIDCIVATGGNVRAELVGNNCAFLKDEFGMPPALYAGSDPAPAAGRAEATDVHGAWGLGTFRAPAAELPPLKELVTRLSSAGRPLDVLVLGPATDAALLLREPALRARTGRLLLMGGVFAEHGGRMGNVTPFAEFNVYADPEAAWAVVGSGAPCRLVPLDATEGRLFREEELLEGAGSGRGARLVADLVRHARRAHVRLGQGDGVFMHDVIAAAVWAGLVEADWRSASVREVVTAGPRRGMIVQGKGGAPVDYAWRFDAEQFLALWHEVVAAL
jgi:inosine-uridine nucleoside N-ribohydrolase